MRHVIVNDFSVLALAQSNVSYHLGRLATTAGHIGVLMLLCNGSILNGLKRRLAAVGQMALTNYVSHSVICAFVFSALGSVCTVNCSAISSTMSCLRSGRSSSSSVRSGWRAIGTVRWSGCGAR